LPIIKIKGCTVDNKIDADARDMDKTYTNDDECRGAHFCTFFPYLVAEILIK